MINFVKKCVLFSILAIVFVLLYSLAGFINKNDTSMQFSQKCNINSKNPKVWLISFAAGDEVYFANQRMLNQSALNNCVDYIKSYNPGHLSKEFVEENKHILTQKRGAGFWLWKPYIILETLNQMSPDDILIYLDVGVKIVQPLDDLVNKLGDADIVAFRNMHTNRAYVKRDLLTIMDMDREDIRDAMQLQATLLVMKNNGFTKNFVKKWLQISKNEKALTDLPSKNEYPEFVDHRHDQSIFSLLYLQENEHFNILDDQELFKYFYHHRRRGYNEGSLMFFNQKKSSLDKILFQFLQKQDYLSKKINLLYKKYGFVS